MVGNPHGVIALSGAARRDPRVFTAQHAFNAHQEARGWAMTGERGEVDRALAHADTLAERAFTRQANTPPNLYWYSPGFFILQRGLTWHTLGDARIAARAATELINGRHELPAPERDSEWAAIFTVAAAEALTTAGEAERTIAQARQALVVCRATRSTRLARALRRAHTHMQDTWPTHATIRELGEELGICLRPTDLIPGTTWFRMSQEPRVDIFYTTRSWQGTPEIREPHKCTELIWTDPQDMPSDTLEFLAPAWNDAQNGRVLREYGFAPVPA